MRAVNDIKLKFEVAPPISDAELNELFAAAWPSHRATDFSAKLARSLSYISAKSDERLIGFVNLAWDGGAHCFLLDTTVHPEFRRHGIGTQLVRHAVKVARERGIEWLHVDYEPHLAPFYAACGFRSTHAGLIHLPSEAHMDEQVEGKHHGVRPSSGALVQANLQIRQMRAADAPMISEAFAKMGWVKPVEQYVRYLAEQEMGSRMCWVALSGEEFAGYITLVLSHSAQFADRERPEIQDLNVVSWLRGRGIGSALLQHAERAAARHANCVAIAVGLHPGYNVAQRLYVKHGYVPNGRGVTYDDCPVSEGQTVRLDDLLVLHFEKQLSST